MPGCTFCLSGCKAWAKARALGFRSTANVRVWDCNVPLLGSRRGPFFCQANAKECCPAAHQHSHFPWRDPSLRIEYELVCYCHASVDPAACPRVPPKGCAALQSQIPIFKHSQKTSIRGRGVLSFSQRNTNRDSPELNPKHLSRHEPRCHHAKSLPWVRINERIGHALLRKRCSTTRRPAC